MSSVDVLEYTRRMRMQMVDAINPGGKIDIDPKMAKVTAALLDGLDRQELGIQKINAAENSSAADRLVAETLTTLLGTALAGQNPFEAGGAGLPGRQSRSEPLPALPVDNLTLVPGETDVGLAGDNLETFAGRTGMRTETIPGFSAKTGVSEYGDEGA